MRAEDAALASSLGADAIGMIFHAPARRNIGLDAAKEIVAATGPFVMPVGVFVNAEVETIVRTAAALRMTTVQLHGDESTEHLKQLADRGLRSIKAVRVDASLPRTMEMWRAFAASNPGLVGIVLETASSAPGGAGIPNDFAAIRRYQNAGLFAGLPVIIAGGLTPENVAEVITSLHPYAVDVSSGVEASLGRKSPAKLQRFCAQVRTATNPL